MEFLSSITIEIAKCVYEPAKCHVGYLCHSKKKVKSLKRKVEDLTLIRDDIERRVRQKRENGKVILGQVQEWMTKVEGIEANAESLDVEAKKNRKWFMGWCPDWKSSYLIGKAAAKKMAEADELINEGRMFNRVSNPPPRPTIASWPTESIEHFPSRDSKREEIIQAIEDEENIIIGVYGMGGVGKTTMITEIAKKLKEDNGYNEVMMVTVSQNPDVKKIQQCIGEQLGQKLEEEDERMRAGLLTKRLKQANKVLVILDDVWSSLELFKIGIPCGDEHRGCKIALTTRRKEICDRMRCQKSIEIGVLSNEESWELFGKNVGDVVNSPEINGIAKAIVNECGGLPIALVTLGTALRRNRDEASWKNTLEQLRIANPEDIEDMDAKVFCSLKLSYDFLGNERIKSFFLLCCLFPEDADIEIDSLMAYAIGVGLLDSVNSLEKARDRAHHWAKMLKDSCLLLDVVREGFVKEGFVKMHDVVRDAAIFIASKEHGFLVRARVGLKEWPNEDLGECKKISLIDNRIVAFPDQSGCPKLQMLLLQNNYLENIGQNFFEKMEALQVLDLTCSSIGSLPQSMQQSMNIKVLCLDEVDELNDISVIGGLTKLEILSLRGSGIKELPKEMAHLTRLRLLDLTKTYELKKITPNVISKMSHLEELRMENSFSQWEIKEKSDGINASIWEVSSLKHLTILHIKVENMECLSQEISGPWENLIKFKMDLGGNDYILQIFGFLDRNMTVKNIPKTFPKWVKVLLERTEVLGLENSNNMQSLPFPFNGLKRLHIGSNEGMKHLIVAKEDIPPSALEILETLHLEDMKDLETFYDGPLPYGFLKKLRNLNISRCPRLRFVFSSALVRNLQQLETLSLEDCDELEKIISEEEEPLPYGFLKKLGELYISRCPRLRFVFSSALVQSLQQLEMFSLGDCDELEKIISEEKEHDESLSSDIAKLQNPHIFQNLTVLKISKCNRLLNVMSLRLARGLPNLEQLSVRYCKEMTKIIVAEEEVHEHRSILPLLRSIELEGLPHLKSLCSWRHDNDGIFLDWPSLKGILVMACPELKRLCIGPESAPNLKEIRGEEKWFLGLEEVKEESSIRGQRLRRIYGNRTTGIHWMGLLPQQRRSLRWIRHLLRRRLLRRMRQTS